MVITSQDKAKIINFDNVETIEVHKSNTNEKAPYEIYYETIECSGVLGRYETEERAKDVIELLTLVRGTFEFFKNVIDEEEQEEIVGIFNEKDWIFDTFKMPEE